VFGSDVFGFTWPVVFGRVLVAQAALDCATRCAHCARPNAGDVHIGTRA
jgi:hypothetical protein